jgi:hypothetical protein
MVARASASRTAADPFWRIALLSVFLLSACGPNGDGGANLSERKDEVFHQAAGGSFDPLPPDDSRELEQGDLVDVSDIGEGRVQFRDGFQVSVFRNTGLQIEGFAEEMSPIDRVQLTGGTLYAASSGEDMEADRRLRVSAGGAVIETLGTEFLVYYDPTFGNISLLWVVVTEGEVEIRAGGRRATVAEGWQIWVEDGIRLSRARPATRPVANWVYPALPMPMLEDLTGSALQDSVVLAGSQCILVADNRSFQAVYRTSDCAWIGDVNNVWVTASQVRCPYPFDALSIGDGPGDSVDQPVVTQDPGQEDEEETPITEPPLPDTTAPPAPAPVEPINDQEISCDEAAAIELGWDEVADASGIAAYAWEMEVSSFPDGPFETLDGGSTGGTSVTYPNLACDHWYQWRVWAIDGAGNQSAPSAPASFSIAPAPEPSEPSNSDVE